jgi:hypothetical protein
MRQILHQPSLEADIRKDGFAIADFINQQIFDKLNQKVLELGAVADHDDVHIQTPFKLSAFNNSADYKRRIYDEIYEILKPSLDALLVDYVPLVINIFEKPKCSTDTAVAIHQNPSFVEEPYFKSVSVWIPLIDAKKENGTVGVLRGSHDVFDTMRAPNMPDVFSIVGEKLQNYYFEPIEVKKGGCAVFDDSLVHWSYPNISNEVRTTVQVIAVPREADHYYYYYNTDGPTPKMDLYEVDREFFFRFNCQSEPHGLKKVGDRPFKYRFFEEEELLRRVEIHNPNIRKRGPKTGFSKLLSKITTF